MTTQAPRMLYVNLSVRNLKRSMDFFAALGFTFNPRFTNEVAACMKINDTTYVMLLEEPFFQTFTSQTICDTATQTEVLMCFSCASKEEVKRVVETAIANGGRPAQSAKDHGVMFGWSFYDLDGHHWEPSWMDPSMDESGCTAST